MRAKQLRDAVLDGMLDKLVKEASADRGQKEPKPNTGLLAGTLFSDRRTLLNATWLNLGDRATSGSCPRVLGLSGPAAGPTEPNPPTFIVPARSVPGRPRCRSAR